MLAALTLSTNQISHFYCKEKKTDEIIKLLNLLRSQFSAPAMACFSSYQPYMISNSENFNGIALNFDPDFFCIHKHQKEVTCYGILFVDIYGSPFLRPRLSRNG